MTWTPESLRAFEEDIAQEFNAGRIRAPIHLDGGNEEALIEIFREVKPDDWVLGSWRQHYHCLLKGVPPVELKAAIMRGRSITLCFPQYLILSSAIVGGILPIAVGLGMGIKRRGGSERVWAFMGDMTATTGITHECIKYARVWGLPIKFIVEDNKKSVVTPTRETWNGYIAYDVDEVHAYAYELHPWPHAGAGKRVLF